MDFDKHFASIHSAVPRQKVVTAYFSNQKLLLFARAAEDNL